MIIDASNFVGTLCASVDNEKLTDAEFRAFVRRTLPGVEGAKIEQMSGKRVPTAEDIEHIARVRAGDVGVSPAIRAFIPQLLSGEFKPRHDGLVFSENDARALAEWEKVKRT